MFYKLFISALCFSKFLMDHNARVTEILMRSSCFELFLVQGGLAIPYIVAACMSFKQLKITLVGINQELAETFYLELVDNSNVVGSSVQRGDAVDYHDGKSNNTKRRKSNKQTADKDIYLPVCFAINYVCSSMFYLVQSFIQG